MQNLRDDSVLVAVEEALASPAVCACGQWQRLVTHGNTIWLECDAYARPSHLPASVATFVHDLLHDRRLVVEFAEELALAA